MLVSLLAEINSSFIHSVFFIKEKKKKKLKYCIIHICTTKEEEILLCKGYKFSAKFLTTNSFYRGVQFPRKL